MRERVVVFVDGPNLVRRADLVKLLERVILGRQLVKTRFYDSEGPGTRTSYQTLFQRAFQADVILLSKPQKREQVDIMLSVDMVGLACEGVFDTAILLAGDSDYIPAITWVQRLGKPVEVVASEKALSRQLLSVASYVHRLEAIARSGRR